MMLTATSPTLLNEESPYNVPFALGLLFSLVFFTLFLVLVAGFLVVVLAGAFVGLGFLDFAGALGFAVVALAFSFKALDWTVSFWTGSTTVFSSLIGWFSSILLILSGISVDGVISLFFSTSPARPLFFFLLVFLE